MSRPLNSSCVVTIVTDDHRAVWVRVIGDLDRDAEPALDDAVTRLSRLAPHTVVLELAGVTFAGATLSHFLVRLHRATGGAPISLRHASPDIRLVLACTGTDHIVQHDDQRAAGNATTDPIRRD